VTKQSIIHWITVQVNGIADRTATIGDHLTAVSTANTVLGTTLAKISGKMEVTEGSDFR
jgi:hypothetical protein